MDLSMAMLNNKMVNSINRWYGYHSQMGGLLFFYPHQSINKCSPTLIDKSILLPLEYVRTVYHLGMIYLSNRPHFTSIAQDGTCFFLASGSRKQMDVTRRGKAFYDMELGIMCICMYNIYMHMYILLYCICVYIIYCIL